jgi:hypothetical protein
VSQTGDVLFYRGGDDLASRLVRWWTGGRFAHCEIQVSETESVGALAGGVARHAIPLPVAATAATGAQIAPARLAIALAWLEKQVRRPYGGVDIVDAALARALRGGPFVAERGRNDCSSLAALFLMVGDFPLPPEVVEAPQVVSPSGLAKVLGVA